MQQDYQDLTKLSQKRPFFGKVVLYQTTTVSENTKSAVFAFTDIGTN
jgi:hypothetical protein